MDLLQQILSVGLVIALLAGALWLLNRKGLAQFAIRRSSRTRAGRLEATDRLILTPHHSLHLVRVADRALLIALHPGGCTVLENLDWQEARNPAASKTAMLRESA